MTSACTLLLLLLLESCTRVSEPIDYGKDSCEYCKMSIVDNRFASELVSDKGKVYKFDDIGCMLNFMKESAVDPKTCLFFVSDFAAGKTTFIDGKKAVFLHHVFFKSPMNGDYAAFSSIKTTRPYMDSLHISSKTLSQLEENAQK